METYGASGPNITHAVNPVSKYKKHASKACQFPLRNDAITCFIVITPECVITVCDSSRQKKTANGTRLQRKRTGWRHCLLQIHLLNLPRANGKIAACVVSRCNMRASTRSAGCSHADQVVSRLRAPNIHGGPRKNESTRGADRALAHTDGAAPRALDVTLTLWSFRSVTGSGG